MKRLIAAAIALLALAGCSQKAIERYRDAGVSKRNDAPAEVFTMPDGFSNFAAKCDGTTRVYTVFKSNDSYGAITAIPNHPACGGY